MTSRKGDNKTKKGFFRLPAELRNTIYEYVLADVQDNMCIDLENGPNQKYRPRVRQPKREASPLSMLLTCRKINREASPMAYSKMSMSLDAVHPDPDAVFFRNDLDIEAWKKNGRRLKKILTTFAKTFRVEVRSHITTINFSNGLVLLALVNQNSCALSFREFNKRCSTKCDFMGGHRGLVHNLFNHVRRITIEDAGTDNDGRYTMLLEGASWLSLMMRPIDVREVLQTFSNLEEIVVRRGHSEQVSYIADGNIYSGESGILLGGQQDWLLGLVKMW